MFDMGELMKKAQELSTNMQEQQEGLLTSLAIRFAEEE